MTFNEAMALQPTWVQLWLNILFFGAFVLPLALLIWRETRLAAVLTVLASVAAAVSINWLYAQMGYVKLLGLPHLIFWGPVVVYLWRLQGQGHVRLWPRRIIWVVVAIICVSLAFDAVDVIRWLLGERTPTILPA
ncbi:hypothetical protein [Tateyamaria sp. SN3-11]|uniref:hypothetical protein n=1 Tax=Tateyamaria sp. SN3-11 TaxID=3092147 RepID=UPI0039EC6C8C